VNARPRDGLYPSPFNAAAISSAARPGPSRNLLIDGGAPTGKLTVYYASPRPRIIHSTATQNPDAGLVDLDYGGARFLVQYVDVEDVVIKKL